MLNVFLRNVGARPELLILTLMVMIIAMLIIPLPTALVDFPIGLNIVISVLGFMGSLGCTSTAFEPVRLPMTMLRTNTPIATRYWSRATTAHDGADRSAVMTYPPSWTRSSGCRVPTTPQYAEPHQPLKTPVRGSAGARSVQTVEDPVFGLSVPTSCPEVPTEILQPRNTWSDKAAYDEKAKKVSQLFRDNFKKYEAQASAEVRAAGPKL